MDDESLCNITNKMVINKLYDDRYQDIESRGAYCIVVDSYIPNYLAHTKIRFTYKYEYIKPTSIDLLNKLVNLFKNIIY